jgi:methionyl-tRNA formyltransferase
MKIACVGYREWALSIYDKLSKKTDYDLIIINSKETYNEEAIYNFDPDLILFYGWSSKIKKNIIEKFYCIMLHPSPLPKYRGGSPIQNQIINGEILSAVTLFIMDDGIDTGPIVAQKKIRIDGDLSGIFEQISNIGYELTIKILTKGLIPIPQDNQKATVYKRRKPCESEITIDEIQNKTSKYLYNKIRMLQDPYPNAFIRTVDGEKIFITHSYINK